MAESTRKAHRLLAGCSLTRRVCAWREAESRERRLLLSRPSEDPDSQVRSAAATAWVDLGRALRMRFPPSLMPCMTRTGMLVARQPRPLVRCGAFKTESCQCCWRRSPAWYPRSVVRRQGRIASWARWRGSCRYPDRAPSARRSECPFCGSRGAWHDRARCSVRVASA